MLLRPPLNRICTRATRIYPSALTEFREIKLNHNKFSNKLASHEFVTKNRSENLIKTIEGERGISE